MKKILTLAVAALAATDMMAQHGPMTFVGESTASVMSMNVPNESDTVKFELAGMTSGNITIPQLSAAGMASVPSFTISGVAFTMGDDHAVTITDQPFSATVTVDGVEKTVTGTSISGTYDMAENRMDLKAVFTYGSMPFPLTYNIKAYFVKPVSHAIDVTVGGEYTYSNDNVTYNLRKYKDDDLELLDVQIPTYQLTGTLMGDLTLGTYTVQRLYYDEQKGGYYKDYRDDDLRFHFTAVKDGQTTMDGDYMFNVVKDNNILVKYNGSEVADIVNTFQMGSMPFGIVSKFKASSTGISSANAGSTKAGGKMYNLSGQQVDGNYKGVVIMNGKKYLNK